MESCIRGTVVSFWTLDNFSTRIAACYPRDDTDIHEGSAARIDRKSSNTVGA